MLSFLRYYFDLFIDFLFALYYNHSASTLARKIRTRQITSEQVVRAFIDQIHQVNPTLNAVVDHRFSEAIDEAQSIDKRIASNDISSEDFQRLPLLGVPFTAKEVISVKGLSHTFGLVSRKSITASFDADVIQQLKRAGAIPLGVTNVPQLNGWPETSNPIYGTTRNPHNTTRTPGGSSGGEASIVAACGSGFGVGTEMGGSVRLPAFMCGVFGHKPCSHLVSLKGILFHTSDERVEMASCGIFVKSSEDIVPILRALVGENVHKLKLEDEVDLKSVRVHYVLEPGDSSVSPFREEMKATMLKAVGYFREKLLQEPVLLSVEELKYGGQTWYGFLNQSVDSNFTRDLTNRQGRVNHWKEFLNFCLRCSDYNIFVMMGLLANLTPKYNLDWAKEMASLLKNKLLDVLGTNGVLLYPSAPFPASYHYTSIFRPFNINLFNIWNALDFCVTQVPMGLDQEGMPLGIQVVAGPFQDHLTIAVAAELEKGFGGYVPPFQVEE